MLNQIRRIWSDNGSGDKDFSDDEARLNRALATLADAANQLSRASIVLRDLINGKKASG